MRRILVLFALAFALAAQPQVRGEGDDIAKLIADLGNPKFRIREAAKKSLWEAGSKAEKALRDAAESRDAEVAASAREILNKIDWGIVPDASKESLTLIDQFKSGDGEARVKVVGELMKIKPMPVSLMRKLLGKETNLDQSVSQFSWLASAKSKPVFELMRAGDDESALKILELSASGPDCGTVRDYAAMLKKMNRLPEAIARWSDAGKLDPLMKQRRANVLASLLQLAGEREKASKLADELPDPASRAEVWFACDDWKKLAASSAESSSNIALRGFYSRLTGGDKAFEKSVQELVAEAEDSGDDLNRLRQSCFGLMMLGKSKEGLAPLLRRHRETGLCFQALVAQMKFKEAFEFLEDSDRGVIDQTQPELDRAKLSRAATLARLGEKDAAVQLFRQLRGHYLVEGQEFRSFLQAILKAGLRELAIEYVAGSFEDKSPSAHQAQLHRDNLRELYLDRDKFAHTWVIVLRAKMPAASPAQIFQRLDRIMEGKEPREERDEAIQWLLAHPLLATGTRTVPAEGEPPAEDPNIRYEVQADCLLASGDADQAEHILREQLKFCTPAGKLRFADLLLANGKYEEAARHYGEYADSQHDALAAILQGIALGKAGREVEGRKLVEAGHWLSLANERQREALGLQLLRRGMDVESRRQMEIALELGWPNNLANIFGYYHRSKERQRVGEFAGASQDLQKCILGCLFHEVTFNDPVMNMTLPEMAKAAEALALIQQGKKEAGLARLREHMETMPGDITTVIAAYPLLKKAHLPKDAESLWKNCREVYAKVVLDYPKYAQGWNSIAWLNANCRQELSAGLEAATKAVALQPENASYRDTLAECHFCLGDKAKAIELMKGCIKSEPNRSYYARQLERFQTKSPETSWPLEDED